MNGSEKVGLTSQIEGDDDDGFLSPRSRKSMFKKTIKGIGKLKPSLKKKEKKCARELMASCGSLDFDRDASDDELDGSGHESDVGPQTEESDIDAQNLSLDQERDEATKIPALSPLESPVTTQVKGPMNIQGGSNRGFEQNGVEEEVSSATHETDDYEPRTPTQLGRKKAEDPSSAYLSPGMRRRRSRDPNSPHSFGLRRSKTRDQSYTASSKHSPNSPNLEDADDGVSPSGRRRKVGHSSKSRSPKASPGALQASKLISTSATSLGLPDQEIDVLVENKQGQTSNSLDRCSVAFDDNEAMGDYFAKIKGLREKESETAKQHEGAKDVDDDDDYLNACVQATEEAAVEVGVERQVKGETMETPKVKKKKLFSLSRSSLKSSPESAKKEQAKKSIARSSKGDGSGQEITTVPLEDLRLLLSPLREAMRTPIQTMPARMFTVFDEEESPNSEYPAIPGTKGTSLTDIRRGMETSRAESSSALASPAEVPSTQQRSNVDPEESQSNHLRRRTSRRHCRATLDNSSMKDLSQESPVSTRESPRGPEKKNRLSASGEKDTSQAGPDPPGYSPRSSHQRSNRRSSRFLPTERGVPENVPANSELETKTGNVTDVIADADADSEIRVSASSAGRRSTRSSRKRAEGASLDQAMDAAPQSRRSNRSQKGRHSKPPRVPHVMPVTWSRNFPSKTTQLPEERGAPGAPAEKAKSSSAENLNVSRSTLDSAKSPGHDNLPARPVEYRKSLSDEASPHDDKGRNTPTSKRRLQHSSQRRANQSTMVHEMETSWVRSTSLSPSSLRGSRRSNDTRIPGASVEKAKGASAENESESHVKPASDLCPQHSMQQNPHDSRTSTEQSVRGRGPSFTEKLDVEQGKDPFAAHRRRRGMKPSRSKSTDSAPPRGLNTLVKSTESAASLRSEPPFSNPRNDRTQRRSEGLPVPEVVSPLCLKLSLKLSPKLSDGTASTAPTEPGDDDDDDQIEPPFVSRRPRPGSRKSRAPSERSMTGPSSGGSKQRTLDSRSQSLRSVYNSEGHDFSSPQRLARLLRKSAVETAQTKGAPVIMEEHATAEEELKLILKELARNAYPSKELVSGNRNHERADTEKSPAPPSDSTAGGKKSGALGVTLSKDSADKDRLFGDTESVDTWQTDESDLFYNGNMSGSHIQPSGSIQAAQLNIGHAKLGGSLTAIDSPRSIGLSSNGKSVERLEQDSDPKNPASTSRHGGKPSLEAEQKSDAAVKQTPGEGEPKLKERLSDPKRNEMYQSPPKTSGPKPLKNKAVSLDESINKASESKDQPFIDGGSVSTSGTDESDKFYKRKMSRSQIQLSEKMQAPEVGLGSSMSGLDLQSNGSCSTGNKPVEDDNTELVPLKLASTGRVLRKPSGDMTEMAALISRQTAGEEESMSNENSFESSKSTGPPRHSEPRPPVPRLPRGRSISLTDTFKKDSEKKDRLFSDDNSVFTSRSDGSEMMYYDGDMSLTHVQPSEQVRAAQLMIGVETIDDKILHVKF
jgi:hypothetical protein